MEYIEEILVKVGTPSSDLAEDIRWAMLAGVPLLVIEERLDQLDRQIGRI